MRGAALVKYKFTLKDEVPYTVGEDGLSDEIPCVDCGCDLIRDRERPAHEQRCGTDDAHWRQGCGEDCPVICEVCREHHFLPYCGGANQTTLNARAFYGGRKGRAAKRRLDRMHTRWVAEERRAEGRQS